ncbi:PepSY domain-containing protein [Priestia endophytica]|uniref:PepSY domain-containing protein n=1 Tax=Priestia endophytica TaxID=135735 RepID=UPI0022829898|nr:PepSY domain-containing protein [Priestia endophytica]MCY8235368.1 PepSY domain-containing protein [Priestia endophytica]
MNLMIVLLTGYLVVNGLSASIYTKTVHKPTTIQAYVTSQAIGEDKAEEIALDELNGGLVTTNHVEENDDGSKEYEVNIVKSAGTFEVDINASTGKLLEISQNIEGKSDLDDELQNVSPKISLKEAKQIALDRVRGTITEINLDNFNDLLVYDIEISTNYHSEAEVTVDAINGKVLKVEK